MTNCPCNSTQAYLNCCAPLHLGKELAQSPDQLMRSRYCAFVMSNISYLVATHSPLTRDSISEESIRAWNEQCNWKGLHLVTTPSDTKLNRVEFVAWYTQANQLEYHHELSQFSYEEIEPLLAQGLSLPNNTEKAWYYHSASYPQSKVKSPARNDLCICHSGKKYKKCCGG